MNIELPPVNTICFLAADGDSQKLYAYLRAKMLQVLYAYVIPLHIFIAFNKFPILIKGNLNICEIYD